MFVSHVTRGEVKRLNRESVLENSAQFGELLSVGGIEDSVSLEGNRSESRVDFECLGKLAQDSLVEAVFLKDQLVDGFVCSEGAEESMGGDGVQLVSYYGDDSDVGVVLEGLEEEAEFLLVVLHAR